MADEGKTYGEQAAGVDFNPSGDEAVAAIKKAYAEIIDHCDEARRKASSDEKRRLFSVAITEAQTAQMWAVKAITYRY